MEVERKRGGGGEGQGGVVRPINDGGGTNADIPLCVDVREWYQDGIDVTAQMTDSNVI